MKKLRKIIDKYFVGMDQKWRALPVRDQRRYALWIFTCYALLTGAVVFSVWYESAKQRKGLVIEHIENPILKIKESLRKSIDQKARYDKRDSARQNKP